MKRQQLVKYEQSLYTFIRLIKLITFIGVVFALIFYGLAINSYFNHEMYLAVLFASIGFIAFHWLRRYVVSIASYLFRRLEGNDEVMDFVEEQLEGKQQRDFFILLDKAMIAIKK